ncbi:uncharacterized protein Z520_09419 [Fonsecaea multimorphosa CBS 102226]|uniref:Uncharacterized protein n=1 Tax=Fonsecaea multimorphosa CBS 102226 TaxID=1442371 RepID=A0A0D2JW44_9EURO|nr:uncharacterized protein Z520_09419 [Fonsecaea multimorphosa CBS 102226]KIX94729.1 hypothetical protein Z520_09419 [Fonsecaea multimorphosa CBS 102226]OAL20503.1 hypothetical protein AYO22_08804 [Fonsecaea multimorphosa]
MSVAQAIQTAKPENSIWHDVPEDAFRRRITALSAATNGVPGDLKYSMSRSTSTQELPPSTGSLNLSFKIEQRLADDFAFIFAAAQEDGESVTAVCIEEILEPPALVIRVAANEGVPEEVKSMKLEQCTSTLSQLILSLSRERILSRMRLFLGQLPSSSVPHRRRSTGSSMAGPERALARMQAAASTPAANDLVRRYSELRRVFESALRSGNSQLEWDLQEVVKESFAIATSEGQMPFRLNLENAGLGGQKSFQNNYIMQIDKLGAYHRIPQTLAREACRRKTRHLFSNIKPQYIHPYEARISSISLTGTKTPCYVHAEIQLIVHHLLSQTPMLPRVIGTSEETCFLCHLFIKRLGSFVVTATHGRLFDQWTIPDLAEYSPGQVLALRTVIRRMNRDCSLLGRRKDPWRGHHPLTKRQNLYNMPTLSPLSTLLSAKFDTESSLRPVVDENDEGPRGFSARHSRTSIASAIMNPSNDGLPPLTDGGTTTTTDSWWNSSLKTETRTHSASGTASNPEPQEPVLSDTHSESTATSSTLTSKSRVPIRVSPDRPYHIKIADLDIVIEIQPPRDGTVTLRTGSETDTSTSSRLINLEDLRPGDEVDFQRFENETSVVLRLQQGGGDLCCLALEWT